MRISSLRIHNFRNYENLRLQFGEGLHLIEGQNGSGKTNLAEAIHYLSLTRTWRSGEEKDLIKDGEKEAYLEAEIQEGKFHREIRVELAKESKKVWINGKPIRKLSELSSCVNVIVFSPMDVPLFSGSPGERRNFLDVALSKKYPEYLSLISAYSKLLRERNAALKAMEVDKSLIEVLTDQMIEVSEKIVSYRSAYALGINALLPGLLSKLRGEETSCLISYHPFVKEGDSFKERAKKAYEASLESDLLHRSTSVGPHREDFSLLFEGKDVATHGSQGENRLAVLALKLAPYFLIEEEDKKPIVVLDDVASELDEKRIHCLLDVCKGLSQVFLTATKLDLEGAIVIDVAANNATRRN